MADITSGSVMFSGWEHSLGQQVSSPMWLKGHGLFCPVSSRTFPAGHVAHPGPQFCADRCSELLPQPFPEASPGSQWETSSSAIKSPFGRKSRPVGPEEQRTGAKRQVQGRSHLTWHTVFSISDLGLAGWGWGLAQ